MKTAVLYVLVLIMYLFGGSAESHAAIPGGEQASNFVHPSHFHLAKLDCNLIFQKKNEEQGPADYLIYVEDEDDDRNITRKATALSSSLTRTYEPVEPHFLSGRLISRYHLTYTGVCKYLAHRTLRI